MVSRLYSFSVSPRWKKTTCTEGTHLAAVGGDDSQISGDPVATFNLHQISDHHLFSVDALLLAITEDQGLLQDETRHRQERE